MKKKYLLIAFVVLGLALGFLVWRSNQPVLLVKAQVEEILKPTGKIVTKDDGFIVMIENISSSKVSAKFDLVVRIQQNGEELTSSLLDTGVWRAREIKEIVVPAKFVESEPNTAIEPSITFRGATDDELPDPQTCWIWNCI